MASVVFFFTYCKMLDLIQQTRPMRVEALRLLPHAQADQQNRPMRMQALSLLAHAHAEKSVIFMLEKSFASRFSCRDATRRSDLSDERSDVETM
jgi:hypothetical protein